MNRRHLPGAPPSPAGGSWLAYAVAAAALLVTALAAYAAATEAQSREKLRFHQAVQEARKSIAARLAAHVAMLRAGSGLFAAHPQVSRAGFHAYVSQLDLPRQYPGIQGIGYSARLAGGEVRRLTAAMRRAGFADFRVWPDHPRAEYHAIIYLEPLDRRNRAAIGYDMFSEPVRRAAMERARDTGLPAASGVVTLVQEIDERKQPGFLIYVPVYRESGAPATEAARRAALRGFVYSPLRIHDLLEGILPPEARGGLGLRVVDATAGASLQVLYQSPVEDGHRTPARVLRREIPVEVADRTWTIEFTRATSPLGAWPVTGSILAGGVALSALLFLAARAHVRSRAAAAAANATLLHETEARRQEAEALHGLGRLLAETLDPEILGARIVENVRSLLASEMAVLYRVDDVTGDLHLVAGVGPRVDWNRTLRRGTATVGVAIAERRPVATSDLLTDPRVTLTPEARARIERSGYRAVLAVPLILKDRVTGGLAVGDRAGRPFPPDEVRLLQTFAQTAVLALENARLYGEERAARQEAELANHAKDQFLAIVSHELRTPLTAMFGWVRLLRSGTLTADRQAQALAVIERNAQLQAHLIDDLLDVSRIIAGKLEIEHRAVDLLALVQEGVEAVRRDADARQIGIILDLDPAAALVSGDARRLQQVIANLLSNAVKFTGEGGAVQVRLGREAGHTHLTVTDTGRGIDPEMLPHVFDPFWQADGSTKRGQGGLGLGLAIVRSIVTLHGGTATASSEGIGEGARFSVTLPALAVRTDPIVPQPAGAAAPAGPGYRGDALLGARLLVVDDHADSRDVVRIVLAAAGAEVVLAGSVGQALDALDALAGAVDAVVTDLGMPGADGYDLIRELRHRERSAGRPATPAVALTAFASAEDRDRVLAFGFQAHVAKPVEPGRLVAVVADLLGPRSGAAHATSGS